MMIERKNWLIYSQQTEQVLLNQTTNDRVYSCVSIDINKFLTKTVFPQSQSVDENPNRENIVILKETKKQKNKKQQHPHHYEKGEGHT